MRELTVKALDENLETVQGDERDTIIFSVAYGMDAQGRLLALPGRRQGTGDPGRETCDCGKLPLWI